jgi:probable rRNA maturation factor
MATITFHEMKGISWFQQRRQMKSLLLELFKKERTSLGSLSIVFCSDDYLLTINREFLNHDTYTDIITFDLSEGHSNLTNSKKAPTSGEIYISTDRVEENARNLKVDRVSELRRVMIHGCLHLCGYKDKLNADKTLMRRKEDQYLSLLTKRST